MLIQGEMVWPVEHGEKVSKNQGIQSSSGAKKQEADQRLSQTDSA